MEFADTTEAERNRLKCNLAANWDVLLGINNLIMRMTAAQMIFAIINHNLSKGDIIDASNQDIRWTGMFVKKDKG